MSKEQVKYFASFAIRRGLHDDLIALNETPKDGEPIFEIDTGDVKIGDGKRSYVELPYLGISQETIDSLTERMTKLAESDNTIREEYQNADNILSDTCAAENAAIRGEFAAADLENAAKLNEEIARAKTAEEKAYTDSKAYTDEVKTILLGDGVLNETFDTLKEISDWISQEGVDATELTSAIAAESTARQNENAAIRIDFTAADTEINARIDALDAKHTGDLAATNNTVASLGTELRSVDEALTKRINELEIELNLDIGLLTNADTDLQGQIVQLQTDYQAADLALEASIKAYLDEQLGVIENGSY